MDIKAEQVGPANHPGKKEVIKVGSGIIYRWENKVHVWIEARHKNGVDFKEYKIPKSLKNWEKYSDEVLGDLIKEYK